MANRRSKESERSAEPDDAPAANRMGYGNPPHYTRFRPGQSGNPRGRPRGAKGRKQIVAEIANEMHWVVEDGKRRRRTTLELIFLKLRNLAAQGNVAAFRAYHTLLARYSPQGTQARGGYMIVPEVLTIEEWERKFADLADFQRRLAEEAEEDGKM